MAPKPDPALLVEAAAQLGVTTEACVMIGDTVFDIVAGKRHSFTGPINKQDGSPWLKAGETASDKDMASMNFYVEGVEGALPK